MFAALREEFKQKHGVAVVAKLKKSWCGVQDASRIWQGNPTTLVSEHRYGSSFQNVEADCGACCHVDDFCVLDGKPAIEKFGAVVSDRYASKRMAILGFELDGDRHAIFLHRVQTVDLSEEPTVDDPTAGTEECDGS